MKQRYSVELLITTSFREAHRGEGSMREIPINMFAVLGAAIAKIIIGALWYSPILFLKDWLELSGITEEQMKQGMIKALAIRVYRKLSHGFRTGSRHPLRGGHEHARRDGGRFLQLV